MAFESDPLQRPFIALTTRQLPSGKFWWNVLAIDERGNTRVSSQDFRLEIVPTNVDFPAIFDVSFHHAFSGEPLNVIPEIRRCGESSILAPDFEVGNGNFATVVSKGCYDLTVDIPGFIPETKAGQRIGSADQRQIKFFLFPEECDEGGITLHPGWNLVSIPTMPENTRLGKFFMEFIEELIWKDGGQRFVSQNRQDRAETGVGYWVRTNQQVCIPFQGASSLSSTPVLTKGWNLIGVLGIDSLSAVDIPQHLGLIWCWDSPSQSFLTIDSEQLPDEQRGHLIPGKGYWVYSK